MMMSEEIVSGDNASNYFKGWYALNKEKLSQKRKERYRNDPDYKAKVLSAASISRKKATDVASVKSVTVNGAEYEAHPITSVAHQVGISRETILNWEACGLIPTTPFRLTGRGVRFYTVGMIEVLASVVKSWHPSENKKRIHIRKNDTAFTGAIIEGWNLLPEISKSQISLDSPDRI
jgi:predicted DNA-binding transcriptional regulator AlpA